MKRSQPVNGPPLSKKLSKVSSQQPRHSTNSGESDAYGLMIKTYKIATNEIPQKLDSELTSGGLTSDEQREVHKFVSYIDQIDTQLVTQSDNENHTMVVP